MSELKTTSLSHKDNNTGKPNITLYPDGTTSIGLTHTGGLKNVIQNGSMRISQRGTSFSFASASGYQKKYTLDRWLVEWQKDVVATVTQDLKAPAAAPADYTYALRTNITDGGGQNGSVFKISQRIEDVATLAGKQVTLSFVARSPNNLKVGVEIYQNYGSGGGQQYEIIQDLVTTNSSYTKYTVTGTLPIPASYSSDSYLCVAFWLSAGSDNASKASDVGYQTGEIDISNVQLEPGPVATVFEMRPIGMELSLCQRYYYAFSYDEDGSFVYTMQINANSRAANGFWPVQMRTAPAVTASLNDSEVITNTAYSDKIFFILTNGAATSGFSSYVAALTADAEL